MGYDVSYHPISEDEIHEWYFDRLADIKTGNSETAVALAQRHGIKELYIGKYLNVLQSAAEFETNVSFETSHGFYLAVVQGFFRKYFYIRGGAFTFLVEADESFWRYTKPWQEILRLSIANPINNMIMENWNSGVYLPYDGLCRLLDDYANMPEIRGKLDELFSDKRIDVFLKAVRFAVEHKLGILEATEVIQPQPFNLNETPCLSNLFNCDTDGPLLFREAALEQVAHLNDKPAPVKKGGFFSRLFGKNKK